MNKKRPSLCSTLKDENMNDEAQESITQTSAELGMNICEQFIRQQIVEFVIAKKFFQ